MKTVKITCDACGKELTGGGWMLALVDERIPNPQGFPIIDIGPILGESHHFCGDNCLREWAAPTVASDRGEK